jgi:hypothetical protein
LGHGHTYNVSGLLSQDGHNFTARINDQTFTATGAQYNNQFHVFVNGQHAQFNLPEVCVVASCSVSRSQPFFDRSLSRSVAVPQEVAASRLWLVESSRSAAKSDKK